MIQWESAFRSQSPAPEVISLRWRALIFTVSGSAADELLTGRPSLLGGSLDTQWAERMLGRILDGDLRERYLAELRLAAMALLSEPPHWQAVETVAAKLMANRGRRVGRLVLSKIITEALGGRAGFRRARFGHAPRFRSSLYVCSGK